MKLSLDVIAEQLKQYSIRQLCGEPSTPELEGMRMLYPGIDALERSYLYMGLPADFASLPEKLTGCTLVCCGDPARTSLPEGTCNLYAISNAPSFGQVFNDVEQVFHRCAAWERQLAELTASAAELQKFIDLSDPFFQYPLAIIDYAESTLAMSAQKISDDPLWHDLRTGRINTQFLQEDSIQAQDLVGGQKPVELYSTGSRRFILIQPINVNRHTVGFLSAHMPQEGARHFSRGAQHLLPVLTEALTCRMRMDELYELSMGKVSDFFLSDLIGRKVTDPAVIQDRARFLHWEMCQSRLLLRIEGERLRQSGFACRTAHQQVQELVRHCDSVVYQKGITLLVHEVDAARPFPEQFPLLHRWLEENDCVCAVSNPLPSLEQLADYYDQALAALRYGPLKKPESRVYPYCDYTVFHSLELLERYTDLHQMIHPMILRINQLYGEDNVMVETLKVYLRCERNITNAAKLLYIHRNSMVYRIEQLNLKLDCDFSDYHLRAELLYSMDILEYLQLRARARQNADLSHAWEDDRA